MKPTRISFIPQRLIRVITLTALVMLISANQYLTSPTPENYQPLKKYLEKESIKTEVKSLGGHQGYCVNIRLKNQTKKTLPVKLEPGRRLTSKDSSQQDIFIVKSNSIEIAPKAEKTIKGYGFCCQRNHSGPDKGSQFGIGAMAPAKWVKLARFIDKNDFPEDAIQNAVWALSNDHPISAIGGENMEKIMPFREKVAKITGQTVPWYYTTYVKDTSAVFSGKPNRIIGEIAFRLKHNSTITINVEKQTGSFQKTLSKRAFNGPGQYTFNMSLNVKGWTKGVYLVKIYDAGSKRLTKKKFTLNKFEQ